MSSATNSNRGVLPEDPVIAVIVIRNSRDEPDHEFPPAAGLVGLRVKVKMGPERVAFTLVDVD